MKKQLYVLIVAILAACLLLAGALVTSAAPEEVYTEVGDETALHTAVSAGGNVRLTANVTLTQQIQIEQDVTLDLNGYTVTANECIAIYVVDTNANLCLRDSTEEKNGGIVSSYADHPTIWIASGRATIESGNYQISGAIQVDPQSGLTVTGGRFSTTDVQLIVNSGTLSISGGAFDDFPDGAIVYVGSGAVEGIETYISGGSFGAGGSLGHFMVIGTLDLSAHPNPLGLTFAVLDEAYRYTLPADFRAEITMGVARVTAEAEWKKNGETVGAGSLQKAINAATEGEADRVVLLSSIDNITVPYHIGKGSFTLDLAGKTLRAYQSSIFTVYPLDEQQVQITFTDSALGGGLLSIRDGSPWNCAPIEILGGNVEAVIEGGRYEGYHAVHFDSDGEQTSSLTVKGGELHAAEDGVVLYTDGTTVVEGGNFFSLPGHNIFRLEGGTLTLKGGTLPTLDENESRVYMRGGVLALADTFSGVEGFCIENGADNALDLSSVIYPEGYGLVNAFDRTEPDVIEAGERYIVCPFHTVTFAPGDGVGEAQQITVPEGTYITLPECSFVPNREGEIFYYWLDGDFELDPGDLYLVNTDTVFTADYSEAALFVLEPGNGAGEPITELVRLQSRITLPEFPFTAPEGYLFSHWANQGGHIYYPGNEVNISNGMTFRAIYEKAVVFTFVANNGTAETLDNAYVKQHTYYYLPENPFTVPEGKVFGGWEIDGGLYPAEGGYYAERDVTVTAVWKNLYTVTLVSDNGTGESVTVNALEEDTRYELPACTFTVPEGKVFGGWEIDGVLYSAGEAIWMASDLTVTAIWIDTYSLIFDPGNGTAESMSVADLPAGTRYPLPENPFTVPTDKGFGGWVIGGVLYAPGTDYYVNADTVITVAWLDLYTVTFIADNGTEETMDPILRMDGDVYALPAPTFTAPEGYGFYGWLVGTEEYIVGEVITIQGDTSVRALWKPIVTISFDPGEGEGTMSSATAIQDNYYVLPACGFTAPEGKAFDGWLVSDGVNTYLYGEGRAIRIVGPTTVTARYKTISIVTFLPGYETEAGFEPASFPLEGWVELPPVALYPVPDGKVLAGFEIDGVLYALGEEIYIRESTTVTHVWQEIPDPKNAPLILGGIAMADGDYLAVGATETVRTKPEGGYAYYKSGTLTLCDYTYEGFGFFDGEFSLGLLANETLTVKLVGENLISVPPLSYAVVAPSLSFEGEGALTLRAFMGISTDILNFSGGTVTVEGEMLAIEATHMRLCGGTLHIISDAGIYAEELMIEEGSLLAETQEFCIRAVNLLIYGGTVSVTSLDSFAIGADDAAYLYGGAVTVRAASAGMSAYSLYVYGGTLDVRSFSGIEGELLLFEDGRITVTAEAYAIYCADLEIGGRAELSLESLYECALCVSENLYIDSDALSIETPYDGYVSEYEIESEVFILTVVDDTGVPACEIVIGRNKRVPRTVFVGGIELSEGEYLANGSFVPTREKPEGGYAHLAGNVLTLNHYTYEGIGYLSTDRGYAAMIAFFSDLEIRLVGDNALTAPACRENPYGIYAKDSGVLTLSGDGSLSLTAYEGVCVDTLVIRGGTYTVNAEDDGFYATNTITVEGGSLTVNAGGDGLDAARIEILDGSITVVADDNAIEATSGTVRGGRFHLTGADDAFEVDYLRIYDGSFTLISEDDGVESDLLEILGGVFDITADEDGITSEQIMIRGGKLKISAACCGLYGSAAYIFGGELAITSSGDGISVSDLTVSGGNLYILVTEEGCAVVSMEIYLHGVKIYLPAEGKISESEEGYEIIADASGEAAKAVFLSASTHVFGDRFVHTDTHHFKACTEESCSLPADGRLHAYIAAAAYGTHTHGAAATCTEAQRCTVCEAELAPALGHTAGAAATCTEAQKCTVCEAELAAALGHKYDNACDKDCNVCAAERAPAAHVDADENELCDVCGATVKKKGLSAGAIVGIAAGSAAVAGVGGFSLVWFVIKKKSFADLLGVFKK
ncbi:MAG: carbohydrate-binding domain-containing protein [Clostridia bacterium]|nr:carbohydrate-binding domain-containing protein [Clostridia bacterium]